MTRTERQLLAIENWKASGGRNSIVAATGVGKTRIALMTIDRILKIKPETVIRIIVPTKVLKDQWEAQLKDKEGDIKVMVLNTAAKKPFYCNFLIIDELHKSNSVMNRQLFKNTSPRLIMGLTATYERLDGAEKEVVDHYCPVCDTISLKEALENGWLSPFKEYKVYLNVDLTEYNRANQEFIQHFSFFDFDFKRAMDAVTSITKRQEIAKQVGTTVKEVSAHAFGWKKALTFRKNFVANHPKKIEVANRIIEARKDKKIITFNSSIEQCKKYGNGGIVSSKQSKKENQRILKEFAEQKTGVIHSSKMLIEGLDCPGLSVEIIAGFNSSKCEARQKIGRTIRFEEGKQAEIFTLVIKGTVEDQWYKKANEDNNFIEINEEELELVLKGELDKKAKTQQKINNEILRY